ncbi:MAG: hemolysin family protein [Planctomycetota bacterium]
MTMTLALTIAALAFVSLSHWALVDYSRSRLEKYLSTRTPRLFATIFEFDDDTILAVRAWQFLLLAGLTLSIVAATMGKEPILAEALGPAIGYSILAWFLFIAFDLWISRPIGRRLAEKILYRFWNLLVLLRLSMLPVIWLGNTLDRSVNRLRSRPEEGVPSPIQEELLSVVNEGEREGEIGGDAAEMIEGLIELHQVLVEEIMTPRTEMVMLKSSSTIEEARHVIAACGHSRIPVYAESRDNIVGILYAKDLLPFLGDAPGAAQGIATLVLREPVYVPMTKPVNDLLREFQRSRVHIAIVSDDYGGVAGLVTIEDILEQIVGDITDEHDPTEPPPFRRLDDHRIEVDARTPVYELNELFPIGLPEDGDYETVSGFISSVLGRIPKSGESFPYEQARFTVLDASDRSINRVLIELEPSVSNAEASEATGQ